LDLGNHLGICSKTKENQEVIEVILKVALTYGIYFVRWVSTDTRLTFLCYVTSHIETLILFMKMVEEITIRIMGKLRVIQIRDIVTSFFCLLLFCCFSRE